MILQKYDFSSKSQLFRKCKGFSSCCLWYCKSTIFQANHNERTIRTCWVALFVILQKYDFSSKSQLDFAEEMIATRCLWYCKSTIFQANHNYAAALFAVVKVVCDTAKVRFFKQITTGWGTALPCSMLFVILQKYDFSSKSQLNLKVTNFCSCCLWYCKSTIFQANHNNSPRQIVSKTVVCDTAKVRFFKQITTYWTNTIHPNKLFVILQKYDFSSKSQQ